MNTFTDLEAMSRAACADILISARRRIDESGRFTLAVSGGKTPRRLYELLGESSIDWTRTHLFWGDERCVPKSDPRSNYRLVASTLLARAAVPPQNVHAMPGDLGSPQAGAEAYESELRGFFRAEPSFDVCLLGMGPDGHAASLFPGAASLEVKDRWVIAVDGKQGDPPVPRLTLTLPALGFSRAVFFLVSGEDKKVVALRASSGDPALPAGRVRPRGKLVWYFAP